MQPLDYVDTGPHSQHSRRVGPALQPPPRDEVTHLPSLNGAEYLLGLELATSSQELHLQVLPKNPVEQRIRQLLQMLN